VEGPGYSKDVVGETKLDLELLRFKSQPLHVHSAQNGKNDGHPSKNPFLYFKN
jgi:hypothetical protein